MLSNARWWRELEAEIETIEKDARLAEENNFVRRGAAIDWLEFHILDQADAALASRPARDWAALRLRAQSLKERLERIDERIFQRLRNEIRSGKLNGDSFRRELTQYVGNSSGAPKGYDSLDVLVNGLLRLDLPPQETQPRESDMVFYQPTPARIVLALVDKANIRRQDVFYDLGSGLGQVCLLVNLLTGAKSKGVEFEPAFCEYARQCASRLNLLDVEFINRDARDMDYAEGTIFFMYTPFKGKLLRQVLRKLESAAHTRQIRLGTFGSCSRAVARQSWLKCVEQDSSRDDEFAVFEVRKVLG